MYVGSFSHLLLRPSLLPSQVPDPFAEGTSVGGLFVGAGSGHIADDLGNDSASPYSMSNTGQRPQR